MIDQTRLAVMLSLSVYGGTGGARFDEETGALLGDFISPGLKRKRKQA